MSSETLAYKGLTAALPRLLRLLERRPASAPREEDRG
jgi:hypothetical protein